HLREVNAIALAARKHPNLLLLIGAREVEPRHVRTRVHFTRAELQHVFTTADLLPYRLLRIECATLIHVSQHDSLTFAYRARIGLFLFRDHAKQRRLARAVWTDDADDSARREREVHVVDEKLRVITFAHVL